jgi:ketosteroid isomerase-like protein/cell division septation protein DedD
MRGVLALWIVCALGGTAGAVPANEATVRAVLDAVASQDTAAFARLVRRDVSVRSIWFEDPDCARQFSGVLELSAERHAAFLRCLATLGLRAVPDGPEHRLTLVYEPGVALSFDVYRGEILAMRSLWLGEPTAAPVTQGALASHVFGGNPRIEPEPAVRAAIAQAPGGAAFVELMTCVDRAGKLERTRTVKRSSTFDGYVRAVEAAAAARTFAPFVAHGKPVRVCGLELFTYPADRGWEAVPAPPPPPSGGEASENATVQALLDAIARQDAAAFARLVPSDAEISSLWFDSAPCAKQFSGRFAPTDANRPVLLKCLSGLGLHAAPSGLRLESPDLQEKQVSLVYEPGIALEIWTRDGGVARIGTALAYAADPEAAPITADALEAHLVSGTASFEPEPAVREALARSPHDIAFVQLLACVDRTGELESVRIVRRSQGYDDYVRAVMAAAARWKFKPFQVHGSAVRACAVDLIAYPASRRVQLFHLPALPPPPPPAQNVPPSTVEANRVFGEKFIRPDDETAVAIFKSHKGRVIGSYKLCIDVSGKVVTVTQLNSTGFPAYDSKIIEQIHTWTYRPFVFDGKAAPVCTAVTFIYSQH